MKRGIFFMTEINNTELNRGRNSYDSKVKNLEGIFTKVQNILNISEYEKKLEQIKNEVNNDSSLSNNMMSQSMQMDYEGFAYGSYINRLDDLLEKVERNLLPFYELHLLSSKINIQVSTITWENINEIISNTKELIDLINSLNTHNEKDKNALIDKAYKTVYSVIMHEEIFNRNDCLAYINYLDIPANRENIGRLLTDALNNLSESEIIDEELRVIRTEGLGYDYLSPDSIRKISQKMFQEQNSEYQERKKEAISEISSKVNAFLARYDNLILNLKDNKEAIKKLYIKKSLLITRILSILMIPIMTYSVGHMLGRNLSNKITEYKTITRTIDLNTGKIIGEPIESFDSRETTYVATVMECSPWRNNPSGVGYIRNVTAYEYIVPDDISDDFHVTSENLAGNTLEKYKYIEPKDALEENDSTTASTILITETYQDKSANQKSTKYIVPFSIAGACTGIIIDVILTLIGVYGFEKTKRMLEELNDEIKANKLSNEVVKNKLKNMQDEALKLQDEYNDVVKRYGAFGDQLIIPEIDPSWLKSKPTKRIRKK